MVSLLNIECVRRGQSEESVEIRGPFTNFHDTCGLVIRERRQEHTLNYAEDRGRGAYTNGEGRGRDEEE